MSTEFPSIAAISFKGIPFLYNAVASVRRNKWTVHFLFTPALLATLFVFVSIVALPTIICSWYLYYDTFFTHTAPFAPPLLSVFMFDAMYCPGDNVTL